MASKFVRYYLNAANGKGHGMHSPFVYQFIRNVLNNQSEYAEPAGVEDLRNELYLDKRVLKIEDFGAGSRTGKYKTRAVREIARSSLKSPRLAKLLFRLARYYQPENIIELGTSLGITTSYFSKAAPHAKIITIEGSETVADIASDNFNRLSCTNIKLLRGNFDLLLPQALDSLTSVDLAYIDGNHRYEPTLNYFNQLLGRQHENTIMVFDDIHWSEEMEKAWTEIKAHSAVRYSIDIFFLGFVFFKKDFKVKQHFTIRF